MSLVIFIKLFLDSCFILCVAGLTAAFFSEVSFMPAAALVLALCGTACFMLRRKSRFVRLAPLLAAPAALFFAKTGADRVLIAIAFCYTAFVTVKEYYLIDDGDFFDVFRMQLLALLGAALISLAGIGTRYLSVLTLPSAAVCAVCGVTLLRTLRHDRAVIEGGAFKLANLLTMTALCAGALVLSSPQVLALTAGTVGFVYSNIILPVMLSAIYLLLRFFSLFSGLFSLLFGREIVTKPDESNGIMGNGSDFEFEEIIGTGVPAWLTAALILCAAALVVFLLVCLFRYLAGKNRRFDQPAGLISVREALPGDEGKSALGLFARRTNRETVRHYYRKHLSLAEKAGGITPVMDSAQVLKTFAKSAPEAPLSALRDIYVPARYSSHAVSKAQADLAKSLYAQIKEGAALSKTPRKEKQKIDWL